jgi:hypothetical protein
MWLRASVLLLLAFALVLVLLTDRKEGVAEHPPPVVTHQPTQVSQPEVVVPQSDAAILATARDLSEDVAIPALRRVGYTRVRKALLASASPARIDHVALMQVFGPFPASVQQTFEAAQRIGFQVQFSGDEELKEQTCRVFTRDTGISCSLDRVADPLIVLALRADAIPGRYVSEEWFREGRAERRYTGARFSAALRVSHKGHKLFSYSIESHTGLQERVGGGSFATKAGAPVYLAMEHAPLSPVFTAVGNFAASVTDPTQRPARWATEKDKEPTHEKGNKVVRSSPAAESAAIDSVRDPETKQLLLSLTSPDLLTRFSRLTSERETSRHAKTQTVATTVY